MFSSNASHTSAPLSSRGRSLLLRGNIQFEASRIKRGEPFWRVRFGEGQEMRGTWAEVENFVWRAVDGATAQ